MAAIPDELIDKVALCGPKEAVRERLDVYRDAGVGTLLVTPGGRHAGGPAADAARPRRDRCVTARRARSASSIGAFGDPGHAFPAIALGKALARARPRGRRSRPGTRWREHVEREGMRFYAGARVPGVPHPRAAAEALRGRRRAPSVETRPLIARLRPGRGGQRRPHAGARARGRARGRAAGRRWCRTSTRPPPRACRRTGSARCRRGPRSAARSGGRSRARSSSGRRARAPRAERDPPPRRPARARAALRRHQRRSCASWRRSRSSSTRAAGPPACTSPAR